MKQLLAVMSLLFALSYANAQPSFISDSLDTYVKREMQRWQIPGLAIAIVKDGKVVVSKGYGVINTRTNKPVDAYSQFQIASNSKAFTGTAVATLNSQNKLLLDEKVSKYMPDFKLYDEASSMLVTVRDLMCHRMGFQTFQGDFLNWGSTLTREEIIEKLRDTKPVYPFRYQYGYNNAGFITAAQLIETVTDTSWDDYIRIHYFEPLQMKHTGTSYADFIADENACTPYTILDNKLLELPVANIENMGGAAAINSCVADMANWLIMQLDSGRFNNKQIVPWKVIAETRKSNTIVGDINSRLFTSKHFSTYGLGWESYDYNGRRVYEHGGGSNGFVTKTEYIPEEKLGILVYTNTDVNSLYDALVKQVIEAYFKMPYRNLSELYYNRSKPFFEEEQRIIDSMRTEVLKNRKPPLDLAAFTGVYKNSFYGKIEIKLEKGKLNMYFEHHPGNIGKLEYMNDNDFLCTYTDATCGIQKISFAIENTSVASVTVKVNDFIDYLSYDFVKEK